MQDEWQERKMVSGNVNKNIHRFDGGFPEDTILMLYTTQNKK